MRKRLQISLRDLFWLTLVAAAFLGGWLAKEREQAREEERNKAEQVRLRAAVKTIVITPFQTRSGPNKDQDIGTPVNFIPLKVPTPPARATP